jgi:hypothetical protein
MLIDQVERRAVKPMTSGFGSAKDKKFQRRKTIFEGIFNEERQNVPSVMPESTKKTRVLPSEANFTDGALVKKDTASNKPLVDKDGRIHFSGRASPDGRSGAQSKPESS